MRLCIPCAPKPVREMPIVALSNEGDVIERIILCFQLRRGGFPDWATQGEAAVTPEGMGLFILTLQHALAKVSP